MRLTSEFWVSAYVRRCHGAGLYAVVRRRGASEAGAICIMVDRLNGEQQLFMPAPQSLMSDGESGGGRWFTPIKGLGEAETIDKRLTREVNFDPDLWIVDVESRDGIHFLEIIE